MSTGLVTRSHHPGFEETGQLLVEKRDMALWYLDTLPCVTLAPYSTRYMDPSDYSSNSRNDEHDAGRPEASLDATTTKHDNLHPQDPLARISSGKGPVRRIVLS